MGPFFWGLVKNSVKEKLNYVIYGKSLLLKLKTSRLDNIIQWILSNDD